MIRKIAQYAVRRPATIIVLMVALPYRFYERGPDAY